MLLLGDLIGGLVLTVLAVAIRPRRAQRRTDPVGEFVRILVPSFGVAVLVFEGLLPGLWMIAGYALFGGTLEDHLLPGASVSNLLRALAIGLVVSTYTAVRAYIVLFSSRRGR